MLEPLQLRDRVVELFDSHRANVWHGTQITITAGPTREAIDPVRYISNHSSGKMGYALAAAAQQLGAEVTLISGPVTLPAPPGVNVIHVESAEQMLAAAQAQTMDVFVSCAAVADYRPAEVSPQKIKKEQKGDDAQLTLVKNPDILKTIATQRQPPFCIGFAAETEKVRQHALDKLQRKQLNLIVANDVSDKQIGFNSDNNAVTVYWQGGEQSFAAQSKQNLANALNELFAQHYFKNKP